MIHPGTARSQSRPPTTTSSVAQSLLSRSGGAVPFSVEFNPPRDAAGEARLWRAVRELERLRPAFVSMTYGAGGSTKDRTVRVTRQLAEQTILLPVAHLTAVGHSVAELRSLIGSYADSGIRNMLVLRGDPPGDPLGEWIKHPQGVEYAEDVVRLVRDLGDFHVGVASFPQGHHRSPDLEHDTAHLVAKLRAGAEYSITQMFFDVEHYLRLLWHRRLRDSGVVWLRALPHLDVAEHGGTRLRGVAAAAQYGATHRRQVERILRTRPLQLAPQHAARGRVLGNCGLGCR